MPNESAKIILAATHGKLTKVRDCLLIEDSINSIQCQFEFRTSDWDNTTKTAVFFRGWATPSTPDADTVYVILDESNTCYIPSEILNTFRVNSGFFLFPIISFINVFIPILYSLQIFIISSVE